MPVPEQLREIPKSEVLDLMRSHIAVLKDSFTNRAGPDKGKITEPQINDEIRGFEIAIKILEASKWQ